MFAFLCSMLSARASHIVGGGFNIIWLHDSTYTLQMRMMRDCINGQPPFNDPLYLGTFDKNTNQRIEIIEMKLDSIRNINFIPTKCLNVPGNLCVEVGYYTKTIYLSPRMYSNSAGYYVSWERCCRNRIIQNITNPDVAGMTFYMEIPPPRLIKNSSPKWTNNPRTLLCKGNPFTYNFNFIDPDGDSLYYSLVNPLQGNTDSQFPDNNGNPRSGPYQQAQWMPPYDNSQQITGTPPLRINPATGEINVTPDVTGIFVSSVRVEEFRFGKKLGEVRLELQYTISECSNNPVPVIQFANIDTMTSSLRLNPGNNFNVRIPDNINFDILTSDAEDSLYVTINGPLMDSSFTRKPVFVKDTTGNLKTRTHFSWQTACSLSSLGPQSFTVQVVDNGCPIPKSAKATFTITVQPMPLINPTDMLCMTLVNDQETFVYWGDSTPASPYFSRYNLYRGLSNTPYALFDSIYDKSLREYDDKNTPDYSHINYSYFMRAVNKCGFEGPPSDTLGTFDQLKFIPDQQKLITVTVEENKRIKVLWPPTWEKDFAQYFLYKTTRGHEDQFQMIRNFINKYDTVFYDKEVDVKNTSYCYHLVMKDTCGNIGPVGKPSCSIVLKGISSPFEHTLSWQPYSYWDDGTQCYNLFRKDTEEPYAVQSVTDSGTQWCRDNRLNLESGVFNYFIEAKENISDVFPNSYHATSRSNEIELIQSPLLHVPNAFTANNDAVNDDWGIHHAFVKDYDLKVYNRWGQLVFETSDKHRQWKGEGLNSDVQQTDVYVYLITYTGWDDSTHNTKGNITLLR